MRERIHLTSECMGIVSGILALTFVMGASASDRVKRTMEVHRVAEIGLEIWVEEDPQWDTRLEHSKTGAVFVAEAPAKNYPPIGMTWSAPGYSFTTAELPEAARGAVFESASRYGLTADEIKSLHLEPAKYGELQGYESQFTAVTGDTHVDVKVFFGHQQGKPAVAMQVLTLKGKLPHINEHIRRAWTNVRYLEP